MATSNNRVKTLVHEIYDGTPTTFKETIVIYQEAVSYFIEIMDKELPDLSVYTAKNVQGVVEQLVHQTKNNPTPKYTSFNEQFYKFPSYFRRAAIAAAYGKLQSYRSNYENWYEERKQQLSEGKKFKKKPPRLQLDHQEMPVFYKGNMFKRIDETTAKIKVRKENDWVWVDITFETQDLKKRGVTDWKEGAPKLIRRGKKYFLAVPYEKKIPLHKKDVYQQRICAVDLGLTNSAVAVIMDVKGTIIARRFINQPIEKDHLRRLVGQLKKRQQQSGKIEAPRYWNRINGLQKHILQNTASELVKFAEEHQTDTLVFEHLGTFGYTKGVKASKRHLERLHYWLHTGIQNKVTEMAHYRGMRVARVNPKNTSRYACDGTGLVTRNNKNDLATFRTGKVYHADLNASYNIGARYYLKFIEKAIPETEWSHLEAKVPLLALRTERTLATLITLWTEVSLFKGTPSVYSGVF